MTEEEKQEYIVDETPEDKVAYKIKRDKDEQPMGDVYDVYAKAVGVHSKISEMTEDYTLTRYDHDVYNQKFPKFIREQRKLLRIIKSYIIIPLNLLKKHYNNEEITKTIYKGLVREYKIIEELIIGELDECVIMGRTPNGEVIKAFLLHGLNPEIREEHDIETSRPTIKEKLKERAP